MFGHFEMEFTFLHFGLQSSHFNICYYHQDLPQRPFHPGSCQKLNHNPHILLLIRVSLLTMIAEYRHNASVPSIFRASLFGRCVVTHSLAGSDFHGRCPAVQINRHFLWGLMSVDLDTLTQHSVHPASSVLLTKNGPVRTLTLCPTSIEQVGLLINLMFEYRLRLFQPQDV